MTSASRTTAVPIADRVPPHLLFVTSAVFHYLGPSFAVLLFAQLQPLGVAWLRIASAAIVFATWRRPWRFAARLRRPERATAVMLGVVVALMNMVFYLAIQRMPLGTVGAIEFLGPIGLAAASLGSARNLVALTSVVAGVAVLAHVKIAADPLGCALAFANCLLFTLYVVLGHRMAGPHGIDMLTCAIVVAALIALPIGLNDALPAFGSVQLLAAAVGVGLTSTVIPYVTDQLAMARLLRATFALLLSILPVTAAVVGFVVLHQVPTPAELAGIALVASGVAIHRPSDGFAEAGARHVSTD